MIVVGLDVSLTQTGIAVVDTEVRSVVTARVAAPKTEAGLAAMRLRIRKCVDGVMHRIPPRFDLVVVERPLPARGGFAALQLERAAAYWFLVDQLIPRGLVLDVHPKTRAKLATGDGNASKKDVLVRVREDFPDLVIRDDNEADAVVLADAGSRWLGAPLRAYTAEQEKAFANVAWPEMKGSI